MITWGSGGFDLTSPLLDMVVRSHLVGICPSRSSYGVGGSCELALSCLPASFVGLSELGRIRRDMVMDT